MSPEEYPPKVAVPLDLTDRAGYVTVQEYFRRHTDLKVVHSPARETSWGAVIEQTVTVYLGEATISLPPDVWRTVLAAVDDVLEQVHAVEVSHE